MRKLEMTISLIAVVAIVVRISSVPGGAMLSTISFGLLWILYLLLGFLVLNNISIKDVFKKNAYYSLNWRRLLWSVISGICLSIAVVGLLFALNRWNGAFLLLRTGVLAVLPIAAISLIRYILKPSKFDAGILIRSGTLVVMSVVLFLIW